MPNNYNVFLNSKIDQDIIEQSERLQGILPSREQKNI